MYKNKANEYNKNIFKNIELLYTVYLITTGLQLIVIVRYNVKEKYNKSTK